MNWEGLTGNHIVLTSHETLFSVPGCQLWRGLISRCLPFLACIFLVWLVGCVVIPTPEHGLLEGRGKIDESDIAFLTVSKTTREDVLLRFGEPDLVLHEQRILIYHWKVSHGYWFAGGGYGAAGGGPIPMDYLFMLEFDGEGRLKRSEIDSSIVHEKDYIDKWTPPGIKKPPANSHSIIMIDPIPKGNPQSAIFPTAAQPVRFRVGEFCDSRTSLHTGNFIGHKKAAFGVIMADVRTFRPAIDMVRAAVGQQLQVMGHQLVYKDADVAVIGEIAEFGAKTSINLLTWDAIGSLDVILEVQLGTGTGTKIIRRYKAKHVSKTVLGPSDVNFEQVMRACLEDMQKQMASDAELVRLIGGRTQ